MVLLKVGSKILEYRMMWMPEVSQDRKISCVN